MLSVAQRIPVGTSVRVRHGHELRENLVIGNSPSKWWAYCHRCKRGWMMRKTHVVPYTPLKRGTKGWELPNDLIEATDSDEAVDHLIKKGILPEWFKPRFRGVKYSPSTKRVYIIDANGSWHSRSVVDDEPKWLHIQSNMIWIAQCDFASNVIVVEDLYSGIKLSEAIITAGWAKTPDVVVAQGTGLSNALKRQLAFYHGIILMLDDDAPGHQAAARWVKELRSIGKPVIVWHDYGENATDPKEATLGHLREAVEQSVRKVEEKGKCS